MLLEQEGNKGLKWYWCPGCCDASVVLDQLSYQANWELVIVWVYEKPVDISILSNDSHNNNSAKRQCTMEC